MEKSVDVPAPKTEQPVPAEVEKKWTALVFKVYEHMIHASEVSFFVSTPQMVSTLGFLVGVCESHDTVGLRKDYENGDERMEINAFINWTLKFVHTWGADFHNLLGPGHYHRSRRIYSHPEYVKAHKKSTFDYFRLFRVEEKVFDGSEEVRDWASRTLKFEIVRGHKIFNMWSDETPDPIENCLMSKNEKLINSWTNANKNKNAMNIVANTNNNMNNNNKKTTTTANMKNNNNNKNNNKNPSNGQVNGGAKQQQQQQQQQGAPQNGASVPNIRMTGNGVIIDVMAQNQNLMTTTTMMGGLRIQFPMADLMPAKKEEKVEKEKRPPILVWLNHAQLELPGEFFDGDFLYTWQGRRYWRCHASPIRPIHMIAGEYDFHALFMPTQNTRLTMIVFYGFKGELCSFDKMRRFVGQHRPVAPCIVRRKTASAPFQRKPMHPKRTIYIPFWQPDDFGPSRIAQHFTAALDLRAQFVKGGFGDLAVREAVPSSTGDPKKISHIQHFGLLTIRNSPRLPAPPPPPMPGIGHTPPPPPKGPSKTERPISEHNARSVEMIPFPMCIILWDSNRDLPVYMGKVTGKLTDQKLEDLQKEELAKKQSNKWW